MNRSPKSAMVVSVGLLVLGMYSVGRASDATAVGGGIVDGPLGLTSQLGFGATSVGGSFQCVMAGRSGGFSFGPWSQVLQMEVHGDVAPGSLTINPDGSATFTGKALVRVAGRDAGGKILDAVFNGVEYSTTHSAGGPGVATHQLHLPGLGLAFGPAPLKKGNITITP
jgi:hypothetical protein